jgi:hypothetical protein
MNQIELLRAQASLNEANTKAFKDIAVPDVIKLKPEEEGINFERNVAESYLKEMISDPELIKSILNYLKSTNNFIKFNKYINVFKRALSNNRIVSLGQFQTLFTSFDENILSDLERTGLFQQDILIKSIEQTALPKVLKDYLLSSEENIDKYFKTAFKDKNERDVAVGDVITVLGADNKSNINYIVKEVSPIVRLATSTNRLNDLNLLNVNKIKYIMSVNNPLEKIKHKDIKWEGRRFFKTQDIEVGDSSIDSKDVAIGDSSIDSKDTATATATSKDTGSGSGFRSRKNKIQLLKGSGVQKKNILILENLL